jgi:ApbE superfamily uncharacterized protein (UPF0280 family)
VGAQRHPLTGRRWHFQHGPIDIVVGADGGADAVSAAHEAAWQRFRGILDELVAELPALRMPVAGACPLHGAIARRMWQACSPYAAGFITPMAAVAGAVAQELIDSYRRAGVQRAWVNNGGDIALHLADGQSLTIGIAADPTRPTSAPDGRFAVHASLPVRGVATSGWRGRSFSLGIADSVTVLARTAAEADAAATIVANAVDVAAAGVVRRPANALKDDSDLGDIPVTVDVPPLPPELVRRALEAGRRRALELRADGLLWNAALVCQGQTMSAEPLSLVQ